MDTTSITVLILGTLAIIAIIAVLQVRAGGSSTTQGEAVSLEVGTVTYRFEADEWEAIRQFLTKTERAAVRALDQARANLHQAEAQLQ